MGLSGFTANCLIFITLAFTTAMAGASERVFTAIYEGELSGWEIELTRTLTELAPGRYRLESSASNLIASMRETSDFSIENGRWLPSEYIYERKVFGRKTVERIEFDWAKAKAAYTRNNRARDNTSHRLAPGLLDPALYQLALQVEAHTKAEPDELEYSFIKRKGIKNYRFTKGNATTLKLSGSDAEAVLYRKKADDDDTSTAVWLLPQHDHVLGRLLHRDGDDVYEVHLRKYAADRQRFEEFVGLSAKKM